MSRQSVFAFHYHLLEPVREGAAPEVCIDEAFRRILNLDVGLGLFGRPIPRKELDLIGDDRRPVVESGAREVMTGGLTAGFTIR